MSIIEVAGIQNPVSIIDGNDPTKRIQFVTSGITTGNTRLITIPDANVTIVDPTLVATLTNKTIAAGSNTITGIADANIASGAAIALSKIGNGDVSAAQLSYLNSVTSNVQTQLGGKAATSHTHTASAVTDFTAAVNTIISSKSGANNGLATLDSTGKIPASQLALNSVTYQGAWNASTNTPTLQNGVGMQGYYYVVSVAGNTVLDGDTGWQVGDWAIFNSTEWDRVPISSAVTSVAGKTGIVTLATSDISSGTFADARIALSNVSQYVGSLNIQSLANAPTGTVVGTSDAMTLTNKSLVNATTSFVDGTDPTKKINFVSALATTGTTLSIASQQTTSQTLSIPNLISSDTLVTLTSTQTLTNKTLTNPTIATITNGGQSLTLPTFSDTLTGRNTTDTLTNKTFLNNTTLFADSTDTTKRIRFQSSAATTGTTLILGSQQSTSQTLNFPSVAANDTVMTTGSNQTITGAKSFLAVSNLFGLSTGYAVGTVSQSTTTVTGVGTTFTTNMVGGVILYTSGGQAFVTGFNSPTSLTVKQSATVASTSYTLYYGTYQQDSTGNTSAVGLNLSSLTASLPVQTDANKNLISSAVNLASNQVTGVTSVANGGSGAASFSAGYFLQGNGTSAFSTTKTIPAGLVVGDSDNQTLTNKSFSNASCLFVDATTTSKAIGFNSSSATAATTLTIASQQTTSQTLLAPNISATDTIVTLNSQQTISGNKTLTAVNALMTSSTYTVGTVSQTTTTVTGSGTTFNNSMVGGVMVFANGSQAYVTGFNSTTTLTVSQSATVTSQTYVLYFGGYQHDNLGNVGVAKLNVNSLSGSLPVQTDANKNLVSAAINLSSQITNTLGVSNGGTGTTTLASGYLLQGNGTGAIQATKVCPVGTIVGDTDAITLSNKTLDANSNTISNIANGNIAANASIAATKIGNGDVSNTQLSYLNSVTSNVQTQINACAPASTSAWTQTNPLTTTTSSTTTLATIATASNTTYVLTVIVGARRTDSGSESAAYTFTCLFRNNGGVLTSVGQNRVVIEDVTAWGTTVSVSGTNIVISVVGANGSTVNWVASYKNLAV